MHKSYCKAVQAIGKIHSVGCTHQDDYAEWNVEQPHITDRIFVERDIEQCGVVIPVQINKDNNDGRYYDLS